MINSNPESIMHQRTASDSDEKRREHRQHTPAVRQENQRRDEHQTEHRERRDPADRERLFPRRAGPSLSALHPPKRVGEQGEDEYANELRYNIARDGERDGFGVGNTGSTHDRSGPNNWIHHNTVERSLYGIEVIQGSDVVYIDNNTFNNKCLRPQIDLDGFKVFVFR